MLIRGSVRLPGDLELVAEEFGEGWSFVQSGDSHWLDKEIRARGWHFIWIAEALLRTGVGKIEQKATASALKVALRRVSERFNAAQVGHFEVSKYPGFFLARVKIYPYQIQQSATLLVSDDPVPLLMPPLAKAVAISSNQVTPAA
ncbi:MAG TPA: hypothetical protein VK638_30070 [Edaphobacter sp.]|jgi:hypothetical protein|nr:hypothetical protein [Edaphobacter sp.]